MNFETETPIRKTADDQIPSPARVPADTGLSLATGSPVANSPGDLPQDSTALAGGSPNVETRIPPRPDPPSAVAAALNTVSVARGKTANSRRSKWLDWRAGLLLVLAAVSIPVWRATTSHAKGEPQTVAPALPVVAVARVQREDLYNEVTYLAEFRPYVEVDLHAKVSGYVQDIKVDFGDKVKAGQLLAKLEVPELQDELDQAVAAQKRAEADYSVAHVAYQRLLAVDKQNPNLVVQQDLDAAQGKDSTTAAAVASAKAEVEKYKTLNKYTRIEAPFDGVITHRYADPGALIQSGTASDTQSLPVVRVSDNYRLRLDFPVDLPYVKDVQVGEPVEVRVDSLGKTFTGTITRCTYKIDESTRKMITEVEVPNPNLELVPGMYAEAVQKVDKHPGALSIPIEAVSSDKDPTVYVINQDQQIEERPITIGLETPSRCEVKSGLKEGDLVLIGSRALVKTGEKVSPKIVASLAHE